mmetsp:Transcript_5555/g.9270  ORF Transcript_5555/g.9270 Transcript_5555/m.9270 type:complete len:227 (+) Transcript_5555:2229-2909(+)
MASSSRTSLHCEITSFKNSAHRLIFPCPWMHSPTFLACLKWSFKSFITTLSPLIMTEPGPPGPLGPALSTPPKRSSAIAMASASCLSRSSSLLSSAVIFASILASNCIAFFANSSSSLAAASAAFFFASADPFCLFSCADAFASRSFSLTVKSSSSSSKAGGASSIFVRPRRLSSSSSLLSQSSSLSSQSDILILVLIIGYCVLVMTKPPHSISIMTYCVAYTRSL